MTSTGDRTQLSLLTFLALQHFGRLETIKCSSAMKMLVLSTTFLLLLLEANSIHAFLAPSLSVDRASLLNAKSSMNDSIMVNPKNKNLKNKNSLRDTKSKTAKPAFAEKHAMTRKKWGVDKDGLDEEYWFNKKIHTLGNTGFLGALHAAMAPISTYVIDAMAYEGVDIRQKVASELASLIHLNQGRILDLCCGVGMSTRALQDAFPNAERVVGVDTSPEMISMANAITIQDSIIKPVKSALLRLDRNLQRQFNLIHYNSMKLTKAASDNISLACKRHINFEVANAEHTSFDSHSFDLITIMYGFHEIPKKGRDTILREARRLLRKGGILALIDISPDYVPSESMLKGEPYVKEYQKAIDQQLKRFAGFKEWDKTVIPKHVKMWILQRA